MAKKEVTLQEIYDGYAKKSKENQSNGNGNLVIDVREKKEVEIIADFKGFKKGSKHVVSKVVYDWLKSNESVK